MYAIVDIAGQQFKVEKDQKVFVHRLEGKEGSKVEFDKVLLIDNDSKVVVGTPVISGAMVKAEILDHLKGDKVLVFKKKRRKGFKKKNGHRQYLTQVLIEEIVEKGAKKAVTKTAAKKAEPKTEAPKETAAPKAAATKKPAAKATTAKTTAAKKPAAKKAAPKADSSKTAAAKKPAAKKPAAKTATAKAPAAKKPAAKKPAAKKTDDKSE